MDDIQMTNTRHIGRTEIDRTALSATIEAAVKRQEVSNIGRRKALALICDKLHDAIACLNAAGIGETGRLRNMLMVAVAKGDAMDQEGEGEDDARDDR